MTALKYTEWIQTVYSVEWIFIEIMAYETWSNLLSGIYRESEKERDCVSEHLSFRVVDALNVTNTERKKECNSVIPEHPAFSVMDHRERESE